MASVENNNNKKGNNLFEQNMEIGQFRPQIYIRDMFVLVTVAKLHFITNAERTKKFKIID